MSRSWVEVSLSRLKHNVSIIQGLLPSETAIIAVVKANAYGHGVIPVANALSECSRISFAVADLQEGLCLREALPHAEILVLGGCLPGEEMAFRRNRLIPSVLEEGCLPPQDLPVHVEIDTGMGRTGICWERAEAFLKTLKNPLAGVYSHFSSAEWDPEYSKIQVERFEKVTSGLQVTRHFCNSAGLRFPKAHFDAVRPGLALYGVSSCEQLSGLKPILSWKTRVRLVKDLPEDSPVGYDRSFKTIRPTRIGVLPVGYADGFSRLFSNQGFVETRDGLAPIVGRVNMDLVTIDLTELPNVNSGDDVLLLSDDPQSRVSTAALAKTMGTIPYEVLTLIGARVDRKFV